jgi:hypothetical protein
MAKNIVEAGVEFGIAEKIVDAVEIGVKVSCDITKIADIDQVFHSTGYVNCSWPDVKFADDSKLQISDVNCVFNADGLIFENAVETQVESADIFVERKEGVITVSIGYTTEVGMRCDLSKFPFDRHYLLLKMPVNLFSNKTTFKNLILNDSPSFVGLTGGLKDKWQTLAPMLAVQKDGEITSYVSFLMPIQRFPGFYMWQIVFPVFIVGCLALTAFAFPAKDLTSRLTIITTLVLTSMVFKNMTTSFIPAVPYLTLIDKYLNASLLILVGVAFENTLVSGSDDLVDLDTWFAWAFSFFWIAGHAAGAICLWTGQFYEPWNKVMEKLTESADADNTYKYGSSVADEHLKTL